MPDSAATCSIGRGCHSCARATLDDEDDDDDDEDDDIITVDVDSATSCGALTAPAPA